MIFSLPGSSHSSLPLSHTRMGRVIPLLKNPLNLPPRSFKFFNHTRLSLVLALNTFNSLYPICLSIFKYFTLIHVSVPLPLLRMFLPHFPPLFTGSIIERASNLSMALGYLIDKACYNSIVLYLITTPNPHYSLNPHSPTTVRQGFYLIHHAQGQAHNLS